MQDSRNKSPHLSLFEKAYLVKRIINNHIMHQDY